jgi:superfamily II DNA/RNA helicase
MSANYPSACILELYLRVQMFISHPQIYREAMNRKYGGTYFSGQWQGTATKLAAFNALLDADSVAPTLVFCNFKLEMEYVADAATAHGYKVFFIRGGMGGAERKHGISESIRLAKAGEPVLMICQIVAGNCGLNLQHLTRVIFYTQHWNPSVMDQAMTRSYRYGQKSEVTVHHLILGSPELRNIDRCMLEKHSEKRSLTFTLCPSLKFAFHPEFAVPGAAGGRLLMPLEFEEEGMAEDPTE